MFTLRSYCRSSFFILLLLVASTVLAAPNANSKPSPNNNDDLDQFIADRGLLAKMQQVGDAANTVVVSALGFLGLPYKRGGNSADTGFDCSGFVKALYEQTIGKVLPRSAAEQAAQTTQIAKDELQPGDLVFFNTMRRAFSHVGIYIGEGKFIHSPKPGAQVRIESINMPYWNTRYDGARRVETNATPNTNSVTNGVTANP